MVLDKNDLEAIERIIEKTVDKRVGESEKYLKDFVEFATEKTEQKFDARFNQVDARFNQVDARFNQVDLRLDGVDREINDIIETNKHFLRIFDNHEKRIVRVETKLNIEPLNT